MLTLIARGGMSAVESCYLCLPLSTWIACFRFADRNSLGILQLNLRPRRVSRNDNCKPEITVESIQSTVVVPIFCSTHWVYRVHLLNMSTSWDDKVSSGSHTLQSSRRPDFHDSIIILLVGPTALSHLSRWFPASRISATSGCRNIHCFRW